MNGNPASGFDLLVLMARSKNARASPYRFASLKPLPSISRSRTCPPTSPLALADRYASPTIIAARRLSPSRKATNPSSPFARASHWASLRVWAIPCASVQARFADAELISRSVYPFAARHQSLSLGSLFTTGISSCLPSISDTSTQDIVSACARIRPTREYISFRVSPLSLNSCSALAYSGSAFGQLKSQASRFASASKASGFLEAWESPNRSATGGLGSEFRVTYSEIYLREAKRNTKRISDPAT